MATVEYREGLESSPSMRPKEGLRPKAKPLLSQRRGSRTDGPGQHARSTRGQRTAERLLGASGGTHGQQSSAEGHGALQVRGVRQMA